jgi:hypothetical protein
MNTLKQTRGDTVSYTFQRKDTSDNPILTRPEAIFFTVKSTFNTAKVLIQKSILQMAMDSTGTWRFTIENADTKDLPYGIYVFDLQITENGAVTTVAKGHFELTQEATWITI